MDKDISIKKLLSQLENYFNSKDYQVIDDSPGDLVAISIRGKILNNNGVYISTLDFENKKYYYECEVFKKVDSEIESETIEMKDNASFDELINVIESHLEIKRK